MAKRIFMFAIAVCLAASFLVAQDLDGLMKLKPGRSRAVTSTDPSFTGNADRVKYIGSYKILLDGKNAPLAEDGSAPDESPVFDFNSRDLEVKDVYLGRLKLAAGKHTLRFEGVG